MNAFFLIGNVGVGKTTIIQHYRHAPLDGIPFSTAVHGFVSPGGLRGLDTFNNLGWTKKRMYEEIAKFSSDNLILHGYQFQTVEDFRRISATHLLHVIALNTSFRSNIERMDTRAQGKEGRGRVKTRVEMYAAWMKQYDRLRLYCERKDILFLTVDNNRTAATVADEVWRTVKTFPALSPK